MGGHDGPIRSFRFRATTYPYGIVMPGLRARSLDAVLFDGDCLLIEDRDWIALHAAKGAPRSTARAVFFANVLAYVHDAPVGFWPLVGKPLTRSVFGDEKGHHHSFEQIARIHELIHAGRVGSMASYDFKWSSPTGTSLDVPVTTAFGPATDLLAFYATALRQHDPLSEFLHYYRVLEAIDGANGKKWIANHLASLTTHKFGALLIDPDDPPRRPRRDLLQHYTRRAVKRRDQLVATRVDIPTQLYNNLRCGIAHAKTGVKTFDFGPDVAEVTRDLPLTKMLARIAIDSRVRACKPKSYKG